MCFTDEYDSHLVYTRLDIVARKSFAYCCGCGDSVTGQIVSVHVFQDSGGGALSNMYECDRCKVVRDFIYRYERHEGCAGWESLAPYGDSFLRTWFLDREHNEKDVPPERKTWKYVWPETVEAATSLRDSLSDPDVRGAASG